MLAEKSFYSFAKESGISANDITPELRDISYRKALEVKNSIEPGDYISIANRNNLAEMLVYCRTQFRENDDTVMAWDGITKDRSWYDEAPAGTKQFFIGNPNQLAALSDILIEGETFEDKVIKLVSNINLNNKRWTPIGEHKVPFRGTFDGGGHGIYNFHSSWNVEDDDVDINDMSRWVAFFSELQSATIKDVSFEGVDISDANGTRGGAAVVSVQARDTMFVNVNTSGTITGNVCAAIVVQAVDSTFYNCINRATINGKSFCDNDTCIVGGFVAILKISDRMIELTYGHDLQIFGKCCQEGNIIVEINHDMSLVAVGQLYGLFSESEVSAETDKRINIIINRCITSQTILEKKDNVNIERSGYFAKSHSQDCGMNFSDSVTCKSDMLDGVIGRTPISVGITIIKATLSSNINRMIIPGSLNTLRSRSYIRNFTTENTSPIDVVDGILSLSPYYTFVKQISI